MKKSIGVMKWIAFGGILLIVPFLLKRCAYYGILIGDAFSGATPVVVYRGLPDRVWENGFEASIQLKCNRLIERRVFMGIHPEVVVDVGPDSGIDGRSYVRVTQGDRVFEKEFEFARDFGVGGVIGNIYSPEKKSYKGKNIGDYPVLGGLFCKDQQLYIKVDNLTFDPTIHRVFVVIERFYIS
jgi:hypothetical protein